MEFGRLHLKNFRSFHGEHEIDFGGRDPGLYFLTGENTAEPRLGSNGAGKSSLLDAFCWALYGRTTRGLRGPQVCNWSAERGCEAALSVDSLTISRGWSPNFIKVDDGNESFTVTQEELERDILPLSYSSFLYAVVLGQFGSFFFDLTPANKMVLLADVLNIDYWSDLSKQARQRKDDLAQQGMRIEGRIESLKDHESQLRDEIARYHTKSRQFRAEQQATIDRQERYLQDLRQKYQEVQHEIEQATADLERLKRQRQQAERKLRDARTDYSQVHERARTLEQEKQLLLQQDQQWQRTLEKFNDVVDQCPYCYQKVDPAHIEKEKKTVKEERQKVFAELARVQTRLQEQHRHETTASQRVEEAQATLHNIDSLIAGAQQLRTSRSRTEAQLSSQIAAAEKELAAERNREDVFIQEWRRYRHSLADCLVERRQLVRELRTVQRESAKAEYWVEGFKSVRLFLLEETIRFLEVETNNALTNLGLLDWRVRFSLQRETKEGAISRGFSVMVYSPANEREVPWEAWAGGETQRLRLAGALALSSLVLNANGTSSNVLLLDEPSAHLDTEGMSDVLDALQYYAQHTNRQIWLIDHRSYDYAEFLDTVLVRKDRTGNSTIVHEH